jgi:hypothetical protein
MDYMKIRITRRSEYAPVESLEREIARPVQCIVSPPRRRHHPNVDARMTTPFAVSETLVEPARVRLQYGANDREPLVFPPGGSIEIWAV